jgi:hypothetical protein
MLMQFDPDLVMRAIDLMMLIHLMTGIKILLNIERSGRSALTKTKE